MNYLLDTNVVSELMKGIPDPGVLTWMESKAEACFLSAITIGEIERGIELLPAGRKKQRLQETFREFFPLFEERVLGFDLEAARVWARLTAASQRKGRRGPVMDSMIEAVALHWNLTIITRNTDDFLQVPTVNPWSLQP